MASFRVIEKKAPLPKNKSWVMGMDIGATNAVTGFALKNNPGRMYTVLHTPTKSIKNILSVVEEAIAFGKSWGITISALCIGAAGPKTEKGIALTHAPLE